MVKNKKRNETIDILKGIATISVLLGHAIQRGLGISGYDPLNNPLFKIIYTYHMPLFMLLSGYVLSHYSKKYDRDSLIKKTRRLLYPTIIWSYLIWLVRNFNFVGIKEFITFPDSIIDYTKTLFLHPDLIIWFLYDLFIFNVWFIIQKNINKKEDKYIDVLLTMLFYLILRAMPSAYFGIYSLQTYFPIYAFGYYLNKEYIKKLPWKHILICLLIYIFILLTNTDTYSTNRPIFYLISLAAITIIYQIIIRLKNEKIIKVLTFFGKYSLEIYLCQCLCLNIGIGSGYIRVITIFISATTISTLLALLTNKIPTINTILYGK